MGVAFVHAGCRRPLSTVRARYPTSAVDDLTTLASAIGINGTAVGYADGLEHTPLEELWALLARPSWQADALCLEHPDLDWFPAKGGDLSALRRVCASCAVR